MQVATAPPVADGIAGEFRRIMDLALNEHSDLIPLLDVVGSLLRKGLTHEVDLEEAAEVSLSVVEGVAAWMRESKNPLYMGGAGTRAVGNSLRSRFRELAAGRMTGPTRRDRVIAKARGQYEANREQISKLCSKPAYIDGALREDGLPLLDKNERAAYLEA